MSCYYIIYLWFCQPSFLPILIKHLVIYLINPNEKTKCFQVLLPILQTHGISFSGPNKIIRIQLSGGQKQRLAITRAIVKDPKVLPDAKSEGVVQDALKRVMINWTTILVANRLSTIKNANVIAVIKNGVIVEKGKRETLINIKDGVQLHMNASS